MITAKENRELTSLKMEFSLSEAYDALELLIDKKINEYKVSYWSQWERDHNADRTETDKRIRQLEDQKKELKEMLSMNNQTRKELNLEALLRVMPAAS
ncbi:hypothetical protein AB2B38_002925 [Balneola sp. MJW-20]|uniref:hypothetical protein n=1 Tax=Gracilimonas aurantiaca TaxID=3234185 RepID=UPI003465BE3C